MNTLLQLIDVALLVYSILIFARALISWVRPDPYHPLVRFLYEVTEPVLAPFRSLMPAGMGIDLSPLIVLILISALRRII